MSSVNHPPLHRKKGKPALLDRLVTLLTSLPVLLGLNILIAGGAVVLIFFRTPQSSQVSAIVLPTSSQHAPQITQYEAADPSSTSTFTPSNTPSPTFTLKSTDLPTPSPTLPANAALEGIVGHKQLLPLSCESRSAVDWAAYFGAGIEESQFFAGLPADDNPELGFVGDVNGSWGQIPPDDYGVHARPIAQRLREYGLNAKNLRHMTVEELKREIAAGRPVIVWVVGHVKRGTPVPYVTVNGDQTTVAKFEHTVIVIGYTETKITVLDGARTYAIYEGEFMKSWNVLENQAVIWID